MRALIEHRLPELYMQLTKTGRKRLLRLMDAQGVSQRRLAEMAGYRSHAYMGRLLRGEVSTLDTDPALRLAHGLGVPVDDLFVPRVSTGSGRNVQRSAA